LRGFAKAPGKFAPELVEQSSRAPALGMAVEAGVAPAVWRLAGADGEPAERIRTAAAAATTAPPTVSTRLRIDRTT
jgi:hypothetical protein